METAMYKNHLNIYDPKQAKKKIITGKSPMNSKVTYNKFTQ